MPKQDAAVSTLEFFAAMDKVRKAWISFSPTEKVNKSLFGVLMAVKRVCLRDSNAPGAKITELAHLLGHSAAGVSQKINVLEQQGLVERVTDCTDRRNTYIRLTDAGAAIAKEACSRFDAKIQEMLKKMGPEKSRQLMGLLEELAQVLEDSSAGESNHLTEETHLT
ncbi:MAG: MarR family winged helix-turn-helix transcriptional regulator [Massiliimalia sp.]